MTRLKRVIATGILASALVPTIVVEAATYYVATTGSNSHPGTEEQPWQTVAHAVTTMVAGDTTYVKGGTYNEGIIIFKRSGTATAPIKLLNYPGESPIIHCINPAQIHRINIFNANGTHLPIGWITIEGFEVRNCYEGLKFHNSHDLTIRRNWFHNNEPGNGILGTGTRVLIDRNIINHNGNFAECATTPARCNQRHGIYGSGTAWTITNNLIYDNVAYGIQQNGSGSTIYDPAKHAGPEFAASENWVMANNVFAYNNYRAGITVWGSTCHNARIENNIFYENGVKLTSSAPQGIDFVSTRCNGIQISNNLSYASGSGASAFLGFWAIEGIHYTQSNNIVNSGNPAFVNAPATVPVSPNFALTERSPARDTGLPLAVTRTAFDGTTRPQGRAYDIGAYEYKADGDSKPPAARR